MSDIRAEAIACLEECAASNAERGHCLYTWEVLESGPAETLAHQALEAVGWSDDAGDMGDEDAVRFAQAAELLRGGWTPPERPTVSRAQAAMAHGVASAKWATVAMGYAAAAKMSGPLAPFMAPLARERAQKALVESLYHAAHALCYAAIPADTGDEPPGDRRLARISARFRDTPEG